MTLEHKILTLIDRGVTSLVDLERVLGGRKWVSDRIWDVIFSGCADQGGSGLDSLQLTCQGLRRLNKLDEAE